MKLVLATHNKGKIREFQRIFSELGWEAVPVADISDAPDPEETSDTFKGNALQKAHYYAKVTNLPVLTDDSGIIADVLGNRPGVHSARYAGRHGDDEANNRKLIEDLAPYKGEDRRGHYVCVIALVWPDGRELTVEGTCSGIIRDFYQGHNGFGYDPLFYIPELGKTMAELSMEEKNKISHRGKALRALVKKLQSTSFD
jgi:XTP/dITP diphosphohydrolase